MSFQIVAKELNILFIVDKFYCIIRKWKIQPFADITRKGRVLSECIYNTNLTDLSFTIIIDYFATWVSNPKTKLS